MAKGNIVDLWTRVPITKYQMIIDEFPHPDWQDKDFIPTEEEVNIILDTTNKYHSHFMDRENYQNVIECKYFEMEDKLDRTCNGFFLIMPYKDFYYNLYFEKEEDAIAFKMTWC